MSIVEKVLFYSDASRACDDPRLFSKRYFPDMVYFCVDHPEVREIISTRGRYFNVKNVPTLLLTYDDANLQIYEGPKVILWMRSQVGGYNTEIRDKNPSVPQQQVAAPISESPAVDPPLHSSTEELTPIQELNGEVETLAEEMNVQQTPVTAEPANAAEKKSMDLKDVARRMQMEREQSLGYNEAELPFG